MKNERFGHADGMHSLITGHAYRGLLQAHKDPSFPSFHPPIKLYDEEFEECDLLEEGNADVDRMLERCRHYMNQGKEEIIRLLGENHWLVEAVQKCVDGTCCSEGGNPLTCKLMSRYFTEQAAAEGDTGFL